MRTRHAFCIARKSARQLSNFLYRPQRTQLKKLRPSVFGTNRLGQEHANAFHDYGRRYANYMAVRLRSVRTGCKAMSSRKMIFMAGGATSVVIPVMKITRA